MSPVPRFHPLSNNPMAVMIPIQLLPELIVLFHSSVFHLSIHGVTDHDAITPSQLACNEFCFFFFKASDINLRTVIKRQDLPRVLDGVKCMHMVDWPSMHNKRTGWGRGSLFEFFPIQPSCAC